MRSLRYLPITFLAGQHGFLLFAPYLAFVCAGVELFRMRRHHQRVAGLA